jgi:hypothetical protein
MTTNYDTPFDLDKIEHSFAAGIIRNANDQARSYIVAAVHLRPRHCMRCATTYEELHNVGRWQCAKHEAEFDYANRMYLCCNGGAETLGCVACDHIDNNDEHYDGDTVTFSGRQYLKLSDEQFAQYPLVCVQSQLRVGQFPNCVLVSRAAAFKMKTPKLNDVSAEAARTGVYRVNEDFI